MNNKSCFGLRKHENKEAIWLKILLPSWGGKRILIQYQKLVKISSSFGLERNFSYWSWKMHGSGKNRPKLSMFTWILLNLSYTKLILNSFLNFMKAGIIKRKKNPTYKRWYLVYARVFSYAFLTTFVNITCFALSGRQSEQLQLSIK